jgi:hypothetical protein
MSLTPEEKKTLQEHVIAISQILYKDTETNAPSSLESLEGIELAVREQVLKHVSPEISIFLSEQVQKQRAVADAPSKAVLGTSRSRKSKPNS